MRAALARLAAGLCLLAAGCAGVPVLPGGARLVKVEAEGWAPMSGENLLSAKHRALAEAQKKAVEKAVGVTVRASTRVEDALNIRQSIEANMGGTIRSYEVLSEKQDSGFYKVSIRAVVVYRPPKNDHGLKSTRFVVRLPDEKAAGAIKTTLSLYDFPLSDSDRDADVLVTGVVETFGRADLRLGGFYQYRARLTLSVVDLRRGVSEERAFEGSALDIDAASASQLALEQAGKESALALAQEFETPASARAD
jgi:hypothetical protein